MVIFQKITAISSGVAGSAALFLLLRKKLSRGLSLSGLSRQGFSPILRVVLPAGGEKLIMRVGQLVYSSMILSMGTGAYVAHNVAGSVESYSYIPAMGFGLAGTTLVGVSLGEGSPDKARQAVKAAYFWAVGIMVPMGLGFSCWLAPSPGCSPTPRRCRPWPLRCCGSLPFSSPLPLWCR